MNSIQFLNRLMLLVVAPFFGILLGIVLFSQLTEPEQPSDLANEPLPITEDFYTATLLSLSKGTELAKTTRSNIEKRYEQYNETTDLMSSLLPIINKVSNIPYTIYDQKINNKLGQASATINSNKLKAQLYYKSYDNFEGYLVKIQLKSKSAIDMVLGGDQPGEAMTTLKAAQTYGAAIAVNAGGFADSGSKRYPLGTTIIDGKYVDGFQPSKSDLFFAGFNDKNELVGGVFTEKAKLEKLKPRFGASFVPVLIKNSKNQTIPTKWKNSPQRAPRVVLANFKHDQILLFVTDGYNTNGSKGATLAEIQTILQQYDIENAYNMDGGGSASLVFNGKVINSPSDGTLRKLPTHLLFYR